MLVAAFTGEELYQATDRLQKLNGSMKILEVVRLLESSRRTHEYAKAFKKQKKRYEKHCKPRNRIAHAHCAGYLKNDDQYVVFAVAERAGDTNLAIEAIPVEQMKAATKYGRTLTAFSVQTSEKISALRSRN
ncbi:MAG: hypothetical protein AAFO63_01685, partial [Pseudomonadota bacterium]